MELVQTSFRCADEILGASIALTNAKNDLLSAISRIEASSIKRYFDDFGVGLRHASLSATMAELIKIEIVHIGWNANLQFSANDVDMKFAIYAFDAYQVLEQTELLSLDISFDNRQKIGTNLLKPEISRAFENHRVPEPPKILCHFQIMPTKRFKKQTGTDGSAGTYEEYIVAAEVYASSLTIPTIAVGLDFVDGLEIEKRVGANARNRARIISSP